MRANSIDKKESPAMIASNNFNEAHTSKPSENIDGGELMTVLLCAPISGTGVEPMVRFLAENHIAFTITHVEGLLEPRLEVGDEFLSGLAEVEEHREDLIRLTSVEASQ
jgi:hypothetical protein